MNQDEQHAVIDAINADPILDPHAVPDALRGPWVACLSDGAGFTYDKIADLDDGDDVEICVVRGSAAPVDGRMPGSWTPTDVLYALDSYSTLDDDTQVIEDRWLQARTIAAALNTLASVPVEPPGPADADPVWVARTGPHDDIEMHRITGPDAAHTGCYHPTRGGRFTTAANARERWSATPCPLVDCWPVTT